MERVRLTVAMAAPPRVRTRRNTILGTDTDTDTERDESLSELLGNRTKKPLVQLSFLNSHCGIVLISYSLSVSHIISMWQEPGSLYAYWPSQPQSLGSRPFLLSLSSHGNR